MKLSELLEGVGEAPAKAVSVESLVADSRKVAKGSVFVALKGGKADGSTFAADAVKNGAVAIVSETALAKIGAPVVLVPDARKALAKLAANFYGNPANALTLLGVTGTNGKTTTAWLLEAMCAAGGATTALLGTIENRWAGHKTVPTHTTPDAIELHRMMREMVDKGVDTLVMEVSSHALAQERVHGLKFKAAAFTNLTRDHLDYHADVEQYFQAKRKLFLESFADNGVGVVNGDDTNAMRIYNELKGLGRTAFRFSRQGNGDLSAAGVELSARGISATLKTFAGDIAVKSQLIGSHNLENIMAAAGVALSVGMSRKAVQLGVERVPAVPGRMQRVESKGVVALVDYAHTDDALKRSLESAREFTKGRLLCVFGCGGDRDRGKRPLMGAVAAEASDLPIVTSDNPRSEDPDSIASEISAGLEKAGKRRMSPAKARQGEPGFLVELDRTAAIELAVSLAKPGDTILVAGKGHEAYQEQGTEKRPFSDVAVLSNAMGVG